MTETEGTSIAPEPTPHRIEPLTRLDQLSMIQIQRDLSAEELREFHELTHGQDLNRTEQQLYQHLNKKLIQFGLDEQEKEVLTKLNKKLGYN